MMYVKSMLMDGLPDDIEDTEGWHGAPETQAEAATNLIHRHGN